MNHNQLIFNDPNVLGVEVRELFAGLQDGEIYLPYVPRCNRRNSKAEYSSTRLSFLTDDADPVKNRMIHST
ncbi:MAG: hypothetical protein JWM92_14 [Candidatus Nomurabacteria bacterium]|jgi:hypothetical protein|nr:hypothetical protein [Candidatus Nomurabacteria bacterium]